MKKLLGFLCLVVLSPTEVFAAKDSTKDEQYADTESPIYKQHFDELFDQEPVLKSEAYLNAKTDKEREGLLEGHFANAKAVYVVELAKKSALKVAGVVGALGLVRFMRGREATVVPSATAMASMVGSSVIGAMWFQYPISRATQWLTEQVGTTFSSIFIWWTGQTSDKLEIYERSYLRKKPGISVNLQRSIETAFRAARTGEGGYFDSIRQVTPGKLATTLVAASLSMPRNVRDIRYDSELFDRTFDCYDKQTIEGLRNLVIRYVAAKNNPILGLQSTVYFQGPPGVGKTRAARLLAQFLDVSIQEVSLSDVSMPEFVGSHRNAKPGLVASASLRVAAGKKPSKNFVFLLDEVDRTLNKDESEKMVGLANYMLKFLDPSNDEYYNEFFQAYMDKPSYTVLAGNYHINDDALRDRMRVVKFPPLSPQCRQKIVWEQYFPELLKKYQHSEFKFEDEDFTKSDRAKFNRFVEDEKSPSMRVLYQKLEDYFTELIVFKIGKRIDTASEKRYTSSVHSNDSAGEDKKCEESEACTKWRNSTQPVSEF